MKWSYFVLVLLMFLASSRVYAEEKTTVGAQIAYPFYPAFFIDIPASERSSFRLEAGTLWGISYLAGAKYRWRFRDSASRSYWEVGALNFGEGDYLGLSVPGGTAAHIGLGTYLTKRESGGWFLSVSYIIGPEGSGLFPNIGYEFTP